MSLFIDHNFISKISSRLPLFRKKNHKLYNFRCPFCLDSEKSKTKKRGYFYQKKNDMFFRCHNCERGMTLGNFLKQIDPSIFQEYVFERYKHGENGHSNYQKPNFDEFKTQTIFKPTSSDSHITEIFGADRISNLDGAHAAVRYLVGRELTPFLGDLYYTADFKKFVDGFETEDTFDLPDDARIIIPFYDQTKELVAFQGRTLGTSKLRYITIKLKKDAPKVFGMDKINLDALVYVTEGPFDSLFLPNAIATGGANLDLESLKFIMDKVFVYDNEPRNPEIVKQMVKLVDAGQAICVWPELITDKDINAMVLAGLTPDSILDILENNVYSGIKARLKIAEWRKC